MNACAVRWSCPADGSSRISVGRPEGQRDRQREPLLLAERQRQRRALPDVLEVVERRPAEAVVDELVEGRRVAPEVPRPEQQLLVDGPGEQHLARALEDVAEVVASSAVRWSAIDAPSTRIAPPVTASSRIAVRNSVVLPEPFGPRTATTSPRPNRASTPCRISCSPIAASTPRNSSRGAARRPGVPAGRSADRGRRRHLGPATRSRDPLEHDLERQLDGLRDRRRRGSPSTAPEVAGRPRFEVQHAVGPELERLLDAVLDDDDRAALVGQVAQQCQQPFRGGRVEVGERLVDDVQPRPHHQDAGHRQELPLAAGQRAGLATEQRLDPGLLDDLADPVADLARAARPGSPARTRAPPRPSRRRSAWPGPAARCRSSARCRAA